MSATSARRLVTAGSLSLALVLAAPAAAFAGPSDGHDGKGKGGGKPAPQATSTASPAPAKQGSASSESTSSSARKSSSAPQSKGKGGSSSARADNKSKKAPAQRAKSGDPRGNNGTVKIDGEAFDDGRGNEPHVGCVFQVDFYGFDAGDTASITFTGHAPTGGGLLHSETKTLISDDAAGGGQDRDATLTYSVSNQLSELLAIAPHPKQGWHVKLAVDVDSAPGGAKQKVFWIDCPQAPAVSGTTSAPATGGGDTTVTRKAVDKAPLLGTFGEGSTAVTSSSVAGTAVSAATASGGKGAGAATVAARGANRPSALPFTGTEGLAYLLALGLSAVGVGTLAHRLGRRRAAMGAPVA